MTQEYSSASTNHGRPIIIDALRAELVGPEPLGTPLMTSHTPSFDDWKSSIGPWFDSETGEEILTRDGPFKRYGVGVLYPPETVSSDVAADDDDPIGGPAVSELDARDEKRPAIDDLSNRGSSSVADGDDFDLSAANQYRPSAMAISLLVALPPGAAIKASANCGRYERFAVTIKGEERLWWVRRPVSIEAEWSSPEVLDGEAGSVSPSAASADGLGPIDIGFELFTRPRLDGSTLVTVALINRTAADRNASLYQAGFTVSLPTGGEILPYPDHRSLDLLESDPEERSMKLLYRHSPTFAIGHGCAATWEAPDGARTTKSVTATPLPVVETPSITPQIDLEDGGELNVRMAALAGLDETDDGLAACRSVIHEYKTWASARRDELNTLEGTDLIAGREHLAACDEMADRMAAGLDWIETDPVARRAFRLANRAILEQQLRGATQLRPTTIKSDGSYDIEGHHPTSDWRTATDKGTWRPFQIGFLLAAASSTVVGDDPRRDCVELIFFPTGGGKTEAYLGLAAFSLFYQRLTEDGPLGVGVLMRYTLRLLTAQQFLRASALVCAMELIRQEEKDLGEDPFSIGIWVGSSATPNRRDTARTALRNLNRRDNEKNPFLVLQCPWCAAGMGPASHDGPVRKGSRLGSQIPRTAGYLERSGTIRFRCPDRDCEFSKSSNLLPVFVIDEDIYENVPSIIIGTVDKFARVTWAPEARSLFGIGADGQRGWSPPNLIIQDELHLISGPLGSMSGLFEALIEDLCTDTRSGQRRKPKIVCSTATIRQFRRQVKDLYDRDDAALFPPFGLDAGDSFFARYARTDDGELLPGRKYVGVYAPGLGSGQTTLVRTLSALLQGAKEMEDSLADPWWTAMCFFNSLRELGITVSLAQSDIPDYLKVMRNRRGTGPDETRYLNVVKELTGRLREDEVPSAIQELSRTTSDRWPVDVCLASSMIEVGIDISRLSLMMVVGQPKTTSQYIQVTGRVGRKWSERPGLVVTLYGASKPRDRSHFERFSTYHNQLYAQVEPVSVTPFAKPVVERAAHAVLAGYVRQHGPDTLLPWPYPEQLVADARTLLEQRVASVDAGESGSVKELLDQREREWRNWERQDWDAKQTSGIDPAPLLRSAGRWYPPEVCRVSWSTPTSLRDVDAECRGDITMLYADPPVQR